MEQLELPKAQFEHFACVQCGSTVFELHRFTNCRKYDPLYNPKCREIWCIKCKSSIQPVFDDELRGQGYTGRIESGLERRYEKVFCGACLRGFGDNDNSRKRHIEKEHRKDEALKGSSLEKVYVTGEAFLEVLSWLKRLDDEGKF